MHLSEERERSAEMLHYEQLDVDAAAKRSQKGDLPALELDISCLPESVRDYIEDLSQCCQCPRDFVTSAVLVAASVALGERAILDDCGFINYPTLWMMVVAPSGSNKSTPVKRVLAPLSDQNYKMEMEWLKERMAKANDENRAKESVEEKYFDRPPRLVLGDITPEALNLNLLRNQNGMLLYRDEARGFFDDLNRYGGTGAITDLLSIYDATPVTVDRVGSRPYIIKRPLLSFYGTTQPAVIADFLSGGKFCDSGFNQRMLFVFSDKVTAPLLSREAPKHSRQLQWECLLHACLNSTPRRYHLSEEAFERYNDFHTEMGMFQLEASDDYQRAIYSKLRIQALRLALVVQGLKDVDSGADNDEISGECAAAACNWCFHYFLPMALKVRSLITQPVQKQISTKEAILFIAQRNAFAKASEIAAMVDVSYSYVHKVLTGAR